LRILILDGNENQAVACVRSLARAGHLVHVGAATGWSKAGWSRFSAGSFQYPSPDDDAEAFVAAVVDQVRLVKDALVLPMTEQTTLPLSQHRSLVVEAGGHLVLPPHEVISNAFDKQYTGKLATSLGIPVPETRVLSDELSARTAAAELPYPVVLKAASSQEIASDGRVLKTGAPLYAKNENEFIEAFLALRARCSVILVQEFIMGTGIGYFALFNDGEMRSEFAHRRIRDVRPTGSGSCLRKSVAVDERVREAGLSLLRALKWHGPAMVEFRLKPDGTPVFMEVNGRFWHSLALGVYAGADFPALLVRMFENGDIPVETNYQPNVRCRWLLGDVRHLIAVWRGAPKGYPVAFPGRLRTLFEVMRPVPGTFHDNFNLSDPLPELGDWLDVIGHRLPRVFRKSAGSRSHLHAQGSYSRT
jgi:predicted ATP-grasp superfamily ATP-dependent carboligase